MKSYISTSDGTEQIVGFYLAGEVLGLDALEGIEHTSSAVALETTRLCEIPYPRYEALCVRIPGMRKQLLALVGRELDREHHLLMLIGQKSVEKRLASFLLDLSRQMRERGLSQTVFMLSMTRYDVANLLGATAETISRCFSRFEQSGLLEVNRRQVRIKDSARLQAIAGLNEIERLPAAS